MRTKLLTSFIVVSSFWWVVSFILWSSGPYSSNLGALKDISTLLEGWVSLKPPVDVANSSLLDSWAVQWFVLMYWTGPILFLTALSTGIGSFRVWKHAAEFKKERDFREAAETTAYRGVGCTKGKLPRIGVPLKEVHQVEIDGFTPEINALVSEILSTIHEGYSNGTVFKGDEVDGDWMEYIEEKCQYVLEVSKEKELAMVAALGVEIGKITAYTSKKGAPGKPLKFSKGGMHKTFHAEGAKQLAKLDAWWKLSPDMRVATVSVLRYLEQPEFMPEGLFKEATLKERVLTAIEDVFDIKPVSSSEPAPSVVQTQKTEQTTKPTARQSQPVASTAKVDKAPSTKHAPKVVEQSKMNGPTSNAGSLESTVQGGDASSGYTPEQEAQVRESLEARFKSMQEQDGLSRAKTNSEPTADTGFEDVFGFGDSLTSNKQDEKSGRESTENVVTHADAAPPWEDEASAVVETTVKKGSRPVDENKVEVVSKPELTSASIATDSSLVLKQGQEQSQKKKKIVVDNTPAAGSFVMTPGAEYMLEPNAIDRHIDKAMLDLWPIMSFHSPNQPKGAQAFGWKQGKRIYLIEIKFREAVAKRIPQEVLEGLTPTTYNEKLNALSRELIAYFIRKGLLVNKIENVVLSAKEPLWKIQAGLYEFNGVFALDVTQEIMDMLPVHNSKFQLSVIGCLWSHTIVSGRFPKRDADGNIVEEAPQPKHEKRHKEGKPGPQSSKPAYKDPTQMSSLPMDLLAPNSGKFKKENTSSDGSTPQKDEESAKSKQNGSAAPTTNTGADLKESKSDLVNHDGKGESHVESSQPAKVSKPTGLDLLSLVTSGGGKPDKKQPANPQVGSGQKPSHEQKQHGQRNEYKNREKPRETQNGLASISKQGEQHKAVENHPTKQHQTQQAKQVIDDSKQLLTPSDEVAPSVEKKVDSTSFEQVAELGHHQETTPGEPSIRGEEVENFSISLTDIVAKSGSLETHVPELNEEESFSEGKAEDAPSDEGSSLELDVDSLLNDFSSDLEKLQPKAEDEDKP